MDILEVPRALVVLVEYMTRWVEAYAMEDQTNETLARLLVDSVVCRYVYMWSCYQTRILTCCQV